MATLLLMQPRAHAAFWHIWLFGLQACIVASCPACHPPLMQFSSSHALPFLTQSLHNQAMSLYTSQDTCPCFHCLCISFLPFSLTSRSQLIHSGLLPSFLDFLHLVIANFCTLWSSLRPPWPRGQACAGSLPGCCLILPSSCRLRGEVGGVLFLLSAAPGRALDVVVNKLL